MARTYTRGDIRTRARMLANLRSTSFPTDVEANDLINVHYCEVYDLLVESGPPEYYASRTTVSTVSGTIAYSLPSDFRSLVSVYANESTDRRRPILGISRMERARYKAPTAAYDVTVEYVPAAAIISTSTGSDSTTIDGVSGWEELIVALVARDLLLMEGSPIPPSLEGKIALLMKRIRTASMNRDRGQARRIQDVSMSEYFLYPYTAGIRGYQLLGGNIELFENAELYP